MKFYLILASFLIRNEIFAQTFETDNKNCFYSETVNITGGNVFANNSIEFEGFIYDRKNYEEYDYMEIYVKSKGKSKMPTEKHFRGCKCSVTNCVRFCKKISDFIILPNKQNISEFIDLKEKNWFLIKGRVWDPSIYRHYSEGIELNEVNFMSMLEIN